MLNTVEPFPNLTRTLMLFIDGERVTATTKRQIIAGPAYSRIRGVTRPYDLVWDTGIYGLVYTPMVHPQRHAFVERHARQGECPLTL